MDNKGEMEEIADGVDGCGGSDLSLQSVRANDVEVDVVEDRVGVNGS